MKRIISFFIALIFTGSAGYCQSLTGEVRNFESKKPIPNTTINIADLDLFTVSDSNGRFVFSNYSLPTTIRLKVNAKGYESKVIESQSNVQDLIIYLEETHLQLNEVTISGSKGLLQKYNVIHIETKNLSDLNSLGATTLSEALSSIAGVYQSSTGVGISKPVIRGMQGIRVVTLLNGLRIENQQWGGDHGMGITELGIGSVEVIKGPSSLLYGADALGGVIYFIDEPYAKQNQFEIGFKTQNESNTFGTSNQLWYKLSKKNYRFNIAGSIANHADYKLPNNSFAANTRFAENGLKAAFGTNRKNWTMHIRYNFSKSRVGIPGETADSIITPQSFQLSKQERGELLPRQGYSNHFLSIENKFFFKKNELNILLGQTVSQLSEFEDDFVSPVMNMILSNSIYSLRYKTYLSENWNLVSGIQGMYQSNNNQNGASEKLLPNSKTLDNGAFTIAYFQKGLWNVQTGIRYDIRMLQSREEFKGFSILTENFQNVNFSAGAVRSTDKHTLRLNFSNGFRAPHLSELLANGEHHGALRYEIGNPNLKSEKANQLDLTYERHGHHLELIINPFFNYLQNFISLQPLNDSIIEGLPVFKYDQYKAVYLYGSDFGLHYHPHFAHWLHFENTISYIQSDLVDGGNLALMPQSRINSVLKFSLKCKSKFKLEEFVLQHTYLFAQNRPSSYETVSPSYQLLNASLKFTFNPKNPIQLNVGVKNIFNEMYIDHLSRLKNIGMSQPGRNIYFMLRYNFSHSIKSGFRSKEM